MAPLGFPGIGFAEEQESAPVSNPAIEIIHVPAFYSLISNKLNNCSLWRKII
jgi:hypothetical protein